MNKQNIGLGAGLLALLVVVLQFFSGGAVIAPPLGSVVGPDEANNFHCYVGGCTYYLRAPLAATSSIIASFKNPVNATSTVTGFRCTVAGQATGMGIAATTFDLSTSSSAFQGSSTPAFIKTGAIPALAASGAVKLITWMPGMASTSQKLVLGYDSNGNTGESPFILKPSEFLNVQISSGTPGTPVNFYTGNCSATIVAS